MVERAQKAGKTGGIGRPKQDSLPDGVSSKLLPTRDRSHDRNTRAAVALVHARARPTQKDFSCLDVRKA
jgi:hypothetical protein